MNYDVLSYFLLAVAVISFLFLVLRILFKKPQAPHTSPDEKLPDVCGPDGEMILASMGPEKEAPLPEPNDDIQIIGQSNDATLNECGHEGPKWYQLDVYGLPSIKIDDRKICPACLIDYIRTYFTRCSLCGLLIQPGDGVALYSELSNSLKYKAVAARVGNSFVGCLRWDCCPSGGFFAGYWTGQGFQSAFSAPGEDADPETTEKAV